MQIATLGIVLEHGQMLLGRKKKGEIGMGVLSGPGGRLEKDETLEECLVRETREEFDLELNPDSIYCVATIIFYRGRTHYLWLNKILNLFCNLGCVPNLKVYVFRCQILPGQTIKETDDMVPEWYPLKELPYRRMYEADRYWFPYALYAPYGFMVRAKVYYLGRAEHFDHVEFFPPKS